MPQEELSNEPLQKLNLDIHFSVYCPTLSQTVYMTKETWFGHILTDHKFFMGKTEELVKRTVSQIKKEAEFSKFDERDTESWFYTKKVPNFTPYFPCLRIAFKRIEYGIIILASAYPVEEDHELQ